jgi:hypothetical protein
VAAQEHRNTGAPPHDGSEQRGVSQRYEGPPREPLPGTGGTNQARADVPEEAREEPKPRKAQASDRAR